MALGLQAGPCQHVLRRPAGENWIPAGVPGQNGHPSFSAPQPRASCFTPDGREALGQGGSRCSCCPSFSPFLCRGSAPGKEGRCGGADPVGEARGSAGAQASGVPGPSGLLLQAALGRHREPLPGVGCGQCLPDLPGRGGCPVRTPASTRQTEGLG